MLKTFYACLFCSVLAVPFLGSSSAHAVTIVNHFGQCLEDRYGDTTDRNPIVSRQCFGLFSQQWKWFAGTITGIGTDQSFPNGTTSSKCLTAFGSTDGTPVTMVECQSAISRLQDWFYLYPGQIFNVGLQKCLTVEDPTQETQLTVRTCDPNNGNQLFSLRS